MKFKIFSDKIAAKSFLISAKEGEGIGEVLVELLHVCFELVEKLFIRLGVVDGGLDAGSILLTLHNSQAEDLFAFTH